jgi:sugar phosphate isomerase/epimerase
VIRLGGPIISPNGMPAGRSESHGSDTCDIPALVEEHVRRGYRAAYTPSVRLADRERVEEIRDRFAARDVALAEVQCWNNLLDPNEKVRKANQDAVLEALAVADEVGAVCAIDTVGSYAHESLNHHDPRNFSSDAFDAAVEMARYFLDTVKPTRSFFTYEVLAMHIVDDPEVVEQLVNAVDRDHFGVHLDLVNLINCPRKYWANGALMEECVRRFGPHIVAAHAKDVFMEDNCDTVRISEVRPGLGNIDYQTYLRCLDELPQTVTLMLEHLETEAEYRAAHEYIRSQGKGLRSTL